MLLALVLLSLFFTMLLFPETVFQGACDGLLLWYQILIPTLFPYLIVTGLLLKTDGAAVVSRLLFRPFHLLFGTSFYGSFLRSVRLFMRLPMGAKILPTFFFKEKFLLKKPLTCCPSGNNASPSFIITFLVLNTIHQKAFCIPALLLLFGTMILLSFLQRILRHFIKNKDWIFPEMSEVFTQENSIFSKPLTHKTNFSVLESCILNSSETLVKVGGYLMIFSVLLALLELLPIRSPGFLLLKSSLEMTNGILLLSQSLSHPQVLYPLLLALTSFGGWCSVAQTQSMIAGTGLKLSSLYNTKTDRRTGSQPFDISLSEIFIIQCNDYLRSPCPFSS